jgi:hypothetical protein
MHEGVKYMRHIDAVKVSLFAERERIAPKIQGVFPLMTSTVVNEG